jgi:hypothetical protein
MGTPSSTRILATCAVRDRPRRYWQAQAAPASGRRLSRVLGAGGPRDGATPQSKGPHRLIEISVSPGRNHLRQHDRRIATDPEIEEAAHER